MPPILPTHSLHDRDTNLGALHAEDLCACELRELRIPLVDVFGMAIFISGVRVFELLPEQEHAPRIAIGRTVIQRDNWSIVAADIPSGPEGVPAFAHRHGMPRRVFAKSPLERKPIYLDTQSPLLAQILCRHARRAAAEAPGSRFRFTHSTATSRTTSDARGERNAAVTRRGSRTATSSVRHMDIWVLVVFSILVALSVWVVVLVLLGFGTGSGAGLCRTEANEPQPRPRWKRRPTPTARTGQARRRHRPLARR